MRWSFPALLFLGLISSALAGGGPLNVAVVVNDNSADSLALGRYYCDQRGIPEAQIVHVSTLTSGVISATAFTNEIYQPLMDALAAGGLIGQVDTVIYCLDLPHAVSSGGRLNGITAVTYYGFKTYPGSPVCTLPAETANPYYDAEENFGAWDGAGSDVRFVSGLLAHLSLDEAKEVVDRSVAADGSMPVGRIYYLHTTDLARNVQWPQFEAADVLRRALPVSVTGAFRDANFVSGETDIVGYMVGQAVVSQLFSNSFVPGALGDHLTSFGGVLTGTGQMEIDDWLRAGCVGAYGTVVEPCNYTNKFPHAKLHYYYGRGFSLGESYAMSVANPYMGIVVGDPLCAPYAVPPGVQVGGVSPDQVLSGTVSISVTGTAAVAGQAVAQLALFVDDRFYATVTNVVTDASDAVSVTVDGDLRPIAVPMGATGPALVQALADSLNMPPALPVTGRATSDRLELVHDVPGTAGTGVTYGVSVTGSNLAARASGAHLLDPVYPARQVLTLKGIPRAGDSLSLMVTPLTGPPVTHEVFRESGDEIDDLFVRLMNAVNQDTNLQTSAGCELKYFQVERDGSGSAIELEAFLVARTNHWTSYNLQADYEVDSNPVIGMEGPDYQGPFSSNQAEMSARGTVFVSVGRSTLVGTAQIDTTLLADGPHTLRAVAYDGSAVRVQASVGVPFVVSNHTLGCSLSTPGDGNAFLVGQDIGLEALVTGGGGVVTSVEFFVEGKLDGDTLAAPYTNAFSTTGYGVGAMGLHALARNDAGEAALSERIEIHLLDPTDGDGDGLPDGWELFHFSSTHVTDGTLDSDGDEQDDLAEFVADTDPADPAHWFEIFDLRVTPTDAEIEFVSSPTRTYTVEANHQSLTNESAWMVIPPPDTPGAVMSTEWLVPGGGSNSFYRVRALAP